MEIGTLWEGEVELVWGDSSATGTASASLLLHPIPHFILDIKNLSLEHPFRVFEIMKHAENTFVRFTRSAATLPVQLIGGSTGGSVRVSVLGTVDWFGEILDAPVYAQVVNFPSFISRAVPRESIYLNHADLSVDGWSVSLVRSPFAPDGMADPESGTFVLTHTCEISPSGEPQPASALLELTSALRYFLSFAVGRWIDLPLVLNARLLSESRVSRWSAGHCNPWIPAVSWFDVQNGDELTVGFRCFWSKWSDPLWREFLKRAIFWYLSSNALTGIDGSIVLSQTGLELIAWFYLEEMQKHPRRRNKKPFAKKSFRDLLNSLQIPLDVPAELPALSATGCVDGPDGLVRLRNAAAHPERDALLRNTDANAKFEAWHLGQWYIELAVLKGIGYHGTYANRISRRVEGQVELLP